MKILPFLILVSIVRVYDTVKAYGYLDCGQYQGFRCSTLEDIEKLKPPDKF